MEYTVTRLEDAKADVHLTFTAEDIENAYIKAYQKAAQKTKINGFRPGKAPLEMVKKVLGESVTEDAITILLNDTLADLYPKFDFKPYNQPKIKIEKFEKKETLVAKATFEMWPEVKLGNYKSLPIQIYEVQVDDSDISENLKYIQYELSKKQTKEEGEVTEDGDYIEFSLKTFDVDGNLLNENPSATFYLGRNKTLSEFESHFLGLKVGEEKEFEYALPSSKSTETPKLYKYQVKINEICKVTLPNLDDDLAKEWGEEDTIEALKTRIKNSVLSETERKLKEIYFDSLLEKVVQNSAYTIPESMIDAEINHIFHRTTHDHGLGHISMEEYAKMAKIEEAEVKRLFRKRAESGIKGYLTLFEIAKAENIDVPEEDFKNAFTAYSQRVGQEKMKKTDTNSLAKSIHDNILFDKVFDFLLNNSDKKIEKGVNLSRVNSILNDTTNKE
jgi:trigger factor